MTGVQTCALPIFDEQPALTAKFAGTAARSAQPFLADSKAEPFSEPQSVFELIDGVHPSLPKSSMSMTIAGAATESRLAKPIGPPRFPNQGGIINGPATVGQFDSSIFIIDNC